MLESKCKEMYKLLGMQYYDSYSNSYICELEIYGKYLHLNKSEVRGVIIGVRSILNKDKYKPFLKCLKRDECEKYKSEYYNECYEKCAKEIGWEI